MPQPNQINGAGFGNALSTETDEPLATAQDEERVNNLEQKAFGTNYHEHEVPDRLDHLEKEVFGSPSKGSIAERLAKLEIKLLGGTGFSAAPAHANAPVQTPLAQAPLAQTPLAQTGPAHTSSAPGLQANAAPPGSFPAAFANGSSVNNNGSNGDGWLTQTPSGGPVSFNQPGGNLNQPPANYNQQMSPQQMANFNQQMPAFNQSPQQQQQMPPQQMQQIPPQQQQQMPPQQMQQQQHSSGGGLTADATLVANSLFFDPKAGEYLASIRRFPGSSGQTYAHWKSFPVRLRLPKDSPESWQRALEAVVARWDQYVPVKLALPLEAAPVDVTWVNQLPPKTLAVTRLNINQGEMHVTVYMLRPTVYPAEVPERMLSNIFMHELGHALGLFGHSDRATDLMYPIQLAAPVAGKPQTLHFAPVSTRDINTLKRIYESQQLPPGITLGQPLEWSLKIGL